MRTPTRKRRLATQIELTQRKPHAAYSDLKLAMLFLLVLGIAYGQWIYHNRPMLLTDLSKGNFAALWQAPPPALNLPAVKNPAPQFEAEIRSYLNEEKFSLLENIAAALRTNKERFPGGGWKLSALYAGLKPPAGTKENAAEWRNTITKLDRWAKQFPDSPTPLIATGEALVELLNAVESKTELAALPPKKLKSLQASLETANVALETAQKLPTKDPQLYSTLLQLGRLQGWESERLDQAFAAGVAIEPAYSNLYTAKAAYLLPQWRGEAGAAEKFARETYDRLGEKDGAVIYYDIAVDISSATPNASLDDYRFSWPLVKEGYIQIEQSFGADAKTLNEVCRLAARHKDNETAARLFERIGNNWDTSVWQNQGEFNSFKADAGRPIRQGDGSFGNFRLAALGLYGLALLSLRAFTGGIPAAATTALTAAICTALVVDGNQTQLTEQMDWVRKCINELAAIIARE